MRDVGRIYGLDSTRTFLGFDECDDLSSYLKTENS